MDDLLRSIAWHLGGEYDLLKAEEEHIHGERVRVIEGIASEETPDQQGETLIHKGIDFGPLLLGGYINYDHLDVRGSGSPEALIGIPTEAKIIKSARGVPQFWFSGILFDDDEKPMAKACWNHIRSLKKSQERGLPVRRMGFSVQGRSSMKVRGRIEKSVVNDMAVTHKPVHLATHATVREVLKSFEIASRLPDARFLRVAEHEMIDLLRSADTGTDDALLTEDLEGSPKKKTSRGKRAMRAIYGTGECKCGELDPKTGTCRHGKAGMIKHMTTCAGWDHAEAESFASLLKSALAE